jgi:hypothetical protein
MSKHAMIRSDRKQVEREMARRLTKQAPPDRPKQPDLFRSARQVRSRPREAPPAASEN